MSFATEPRVFDDATIVIASWEVAGARALRLLPDKLTPTAPTLLSIVGVATGGVRMVTARLSCRQGVRARSYVIGGAVEGLDPAEFEPWGLRLTAAPVVIDARYDRVQVQALGATIDLVDALPLSPDDVQFVVGLHPFDGSLVQVELDVDPTRADRYRPLVSGFDGAAWGDARIGLAAPVAATVSRGRFTLPAVRYVS